MGAFEILKHHAELFQVFLTVLCFILIKWMSKPYPYIIGSFLISISAWFSFKELDKRIEIKTVFSGIKNRFIKK